MNSELKKKLEKAKAEIQKILEDNNFYISGFDMVLVDNETELEIDF